MRLRLFVRRHGLPECPVAWVIDTSSAPTIFQLLEQVNDAFPLESDSGWGLEDYAVEIRGNNGANFECLHFQPVASVMKEDDEVIIRPLLTQDTKMRRVSGRIQILPNGTRLHDGCAFGRPLLRRQASRPPIHIPPKKRVRLTYDEDEASDEEVPTLKETAEPEGNTSQKLILHADFEDDDSEDDEDFVLQDDDEDEDEDEDLDDNDDEAESEKEQDPDAIDDEEQTDDAPVHKEEATPSTPPRKSKKRKAAAYEEAETAIEHANSTAPTIDEHEATLADVSDPEIQAKIRKLHLAFPSSRMAVCKHVFVGRNGDMDEAYETLRLGFTATKPKSSVTNEINEEPPRRRTRTRSISNNLSRDKSEESTESGAEPDTALLKYYDKNGLPPGSIQSGKALSFMAEIVQSSPDRPRPESRRSASVVSNKSVRFALNGNLLDRLTSTPAIDKESQEVEVNDVESKEASEEDATSSSESSDSSSDSDSDSSSEVVENSEVKKVEETSSSESDSDSDSSSDSSSEEVEKSEEKPAEETSSESDSSSDSSSEDEGPEETSSKGSTNIVPKTDKAPSLSSAKLPSPPKIVKLVPYGQGRGATHKRNDRRRHANALNRYKKKGILPAGTTIHEFEGLELNENTVPEEALAALEAFRASEKFSNKVGDAASKAASKAEEFNLRKQELLASLSATGDETTHESHGQTSESPSIPVEAPAVAKTTTDTPMDGVTFTDSAPLADSVPESQIVSNFSAVSDILPTSKLGADTGESEMATEAVKPSTAPEVPRVTKPSASPKPLPLSSSAEASQAKPRRSKLDLGAGRRMLFGALGVKAPKTKKDEEKVRNDLMKSIRPLKVTKENEEVPAEVEIADEDDPEAWRNKITYRAVECVQEGIELSEPPFPFVQRWDPQQKGVWPQKGNRGGKRKKEQHNETQYYDDSRASKKQKRQKGKGKGKHSYAKEQEYLDETYEPSYQDDTMDTQYDNSFQDVDGEVSQQLMNDIQSPSAAVSQEPDDLAPLPEDPSSLPNLESGQVQVGMTIVFKTLEMSAMTNWQPQVSSYCTAIVIAIPETDVLQLTLAMRDRKITTKHYDEQTGERLYDKFEVPDEEDEEDDGMLNLSFGELIEPKILQSPPANLETDMDSQSQGKDGPSDDNLRTQSHEEEPAEAQFSHVTETPLNSDAQEPSQPDVAEHHPSEQQASQPEVDKENIPDQPVLVDEPEVVREKTPEQPVFDLALAEELIEDPVTPRVSADDEIFPAQPDAQPEISEESRRNISHLMKEAGFRSNVPSSVMKDIRPEGMESPGEAAVFEKLRKEMTEISQDSAYSPKFNGLGSSPPPIVQRETSQTPTKNREVPKSPNKPQSSWETIEYYDAPSSPPQAQQVTSSWVTEEGILSSHAQAQQESNWVTDNEEPSSAPSKQLKTSSDKIEVQEAPPSSHHTRQLERSHNEMEVQDEPPSNPLSPEQAAPDSGPNSPVLDDEEPEICLAQDLWQNYKPKKREPSPDSDSENTKISVDAPLGLDGVTEKESEPIVQYPKLSIGSSFTSQITDHGHQPEYNFDDVSNIDTPKIAEEIDNSHIESPQPQIEPKKEVTNLPRKSLLDQRDASNSRTKVSPRNATAAQPKEPKGLANKSPFLDDDSSSDEFPSLEALSQQVRQSSQQVRPSQREKVTPVPKVNHKRSERPEHTSTFALDGESSDDQTTPKASQQMGSISRGRSSKGRESERPASQSRPRISKPQASQSKGDSSWIPQGSQVWDLTQDSDAEPELVVEPKAPVTALGEESSDDIAPREFVRYDEHVDDYVKDEKTNSNKVGNLPKAEARRHMGTGLRESSHSSLNGQNRRKTSAR